MKKKKDTQLAFSVIPDGEQGTVLSTALDLSTLEAHLWEAANILRGPVDAADFKTYIFPLLFFKRISDVYDEEIATALSESGGDQEYALFPENHRFQIPESCHWRDIRALTTNIGQALQYAMREIEKANQRTLYGIFGDASWTNKDRLSDELLAGFDAPILQSMYLDKPMKEHNLLQAICRTNRPYPNKSHGLIVDYLGVFDDVAVALDFDEKSMRRVISGLDELRGQLPGAVDRCLSHFPGVDRTIEGYEGLIAAQECLPDNEKRDAFAADYSVLARLWEALSPDDCLQPYVEDYRWLTQVYESVKPPSGHGKLLWYALGAKTIKLIHENIHVETVRDDLDTLVMDADVLAEILELQDPRKSQELEIKIIARLRKHKDIPKFVELGRRLEELKQRHEQGLLVNLAFIKQLLEIAKEVVEAEKEVETTEEQDKGKAALTELFNEVRNGNTPVMVERIVNDIDQIVRIVRFPGWQQTIAGDREVKQALRKTLLKYKLHQEQDLFDRAYQYIKQYY